MILFFVANSFGISKGIVTRDQPIGRQHIAPQRERSISVLSNHFVSSVRTVTNRAQDRVGDDVNDHGKHFVRYRSDGQVWIDLCRELRGTTKHANSDSHQCVLQGKFRSRGLAYGTAGTTPPVSVP
jgi:hypothetical protein